MGLHPTSAGAARARLHRHTQQRAFESFLRYGRSASLEAKLVAEHEVSLRQLDDGHATRFYTWRTARDERVRSTHHELEGRVFSWDSPSRRGHPGDEESCRCWPEPYYGSPLALGAQVPLVREHLTEATGRKVWSTVETARRPDGSLAASTVTLRSGSRIASSFAGSTVVNKVQLPSGQAVRLERRDGLHSVYVGEASTPVLRFAWTNEPPKPERQHVAQLLRTLPLATPLPGAPPAAIDFDVVTFATDFFSNLDALARGVPTGSSAGLAMLEWFNAANAHPESVGAGAGDVTALRAWKDPKDAKSLLTGVTILTAAQAAQFCKILPDAQQWLDDAYLALLADRAMLSPQAWGIKVHKLVEATVLAMRARFPLVYGNVHTEFSISPDGGDATRGKLGSTRLDILEEVRPGLVCVYDIKTGHAELSPGRVDTIADSSDQEVPWCDLHHNRDQAVRMTTRADVRRWVQPLLKRRPDMVLLRNLLLLKPVGHVMRGIHFWPALNPDWTNVGWFMVPLVVPSESQGLRLVSSIPLGRNTLPGFQGEMEEKVRFSVETYLSQAPTLGDMRDFAIVERPKHAGGFTGLTFDRYPREYAVVLAALGEMEAAETMLRGALEQEGAEERERLASGEALLSQKRNSRIAKNRIEFARFHLAGLDKLRPLLTLLEAKDREGIGALLQAWERENVVKWGVEHLWRPTPFPVETGD